MSSGRGADVRAAPGGSNWGMVFRRRRRAGRPHRLHVCAICGVDAVNPVLVEPLDEHRWSVVLRCGACGARTEAEISNQVAELYDKDLDIGWRKIRSAVETIDETNMAAWTDTFITALDRDLIDAEDFNPAHDR
jgi:transcription elongation factor Elf1